MTTSLDEIDFTGLDVATLPPDLVQAGRAVWADRLRSEYRSIQVATRFLGEALAAGLPGNVIDTVSETIAEEIRHTEICRRMCSALGGTVPSAIAIAAPLEKLHEVPLEERVLASAISFYLVAETFSVGYLEDLVERASHPVTRAVLEAIHGDEAQHQSFGPDLVRTLLPPGAPRREPWRGFTRRLVDGHLGRADRVLERVPAAERALARWPEEQLAMLGLHGEVRLALLCRQTHARRLLPVLRELDLD